MTVIEMPKISATRADATHAMDGLEADLHGKNVKVAFPEGAMGTPSVLSEILRALLINVGASTITFIGASAYMVDILTEMAGEAGLGERIAFEDATPRNAQLF